jgi:hypothetical protein
MDEMNMNEMEIDGMDIVEIAETLLEMYDINWDAVGLDPDGTELCVCDCHDTNMDVIFGDALERANAVMYGHEIEKNDTINRVFNK